MSTQIPDLMHSILVETTGNDFPIPGDDTRAPHAKTAVGQAVFEGEPVNR